MKSSRRLAQARNVGIETPGAFLSDSILTAARVAPPQSHAGQRGPAGARHVTFGSALFLVAYVAVDEIADIAFIFLLFLKDLVFGRGRNFIFLGIRFLE